MRRPRICRALALSASILASAGLTLPGALHAAVTKKPGVPVVSTGGVTHVRGTSGELNGSVDPRGVATSYYFQYGPTVAYGAQSTPATLATGTSKTKVAQTVTGLLAGYHYRIVATNQYGTALGHDRTLSANTSKPKFTVPKKTEPVTYGGTMTLSGSLTGANRASRHIVLQSSPFPYLTPFVAVGTPILTDGAGRFTFHVANLITSAQFRVGTLDAKPMYSSIVNQSVTAKVTLKVHSAGHSGLVRLSGTITPAEPGAPVTIQLRKPIRPGGKSEQTTRFVSRFATVSKRATKRTSRFSVVIKVRETGRYRAYVRLRKGAIASGGSASVVLKAPTGSTKQRRKKH